MRQVIHADRDGKYVAIDNPGAVVVDHGAQMIRIGLERWPFSRPSLWTFLVLLLRTPDEIVPYEAFGGASRGYASKLAGEASPLLEEIEASLETVDEVGLRLHINPRESLECCRNLAPGQPLPTRVRSMLRGHGGRHMIPIISPSSSTPGTRARSRRRML